MLISTVGDYYWEVMTPQAEALNGVDEPHGRDSYTFTSFPARTSVGSREQHERVIVPRADVVDREKRSVLKTSSIKLKTKM